MTKLVRLILVGFGNTGRLFCQFLQDPSKCQRFSRFFQSRNIQFLVVGITTATRGNLFNPNGVDFLRALTEVTTIGRFSAANDDISELSTLQMISSCEFDVLVEVSTLNIKLRGQPAISHIETALSRGKHVVTANKGPLAFDYLRLTTLSKEKNVRLLYESTVMDGCPIFNLGRSTLLGCQVTGIAGILNSTTNFVLSRMEEGVEMGEAIKEAQIAGFAEADPSLDIDGWDAACKLAVLVNSFLLPICGTINSSPIILPPLSSEISTDSDSSQTHEMSSSSPPLLIGEITPDLIQVSGIREITREIIESAREEGKKLKLVARAHLTPLISNPSTSLEGSHQPALLAFEPLLDSLEPSIPFTLTCSVCVESVSQTNQSQASFAMCIGNGSVLQIESDLMAPIFVTQTTPTLSDTVYGLLNDLCEIFI